MNPDSFLTHSLRTHPQGAAITSVMAAALDAVDPYAAVLRYLRREGDSLWVGENVYDLAVVQRVYVVGAGKAGFPMARAVEDVLGERISGGVVIVKDGYAPAGVKLHAVECLEAAHPVPDERGVRATRRIAATLEGLSAHDLVLCLISGGGSALMMAPADGISLADIQAMTAQLLGCGASINEINCMRKHVDLIKGGGLARWASPAQVVALILSDVIGDPLDVIASGPCVPDLTTYSDAYAVLERYHLLETIPAAISGRMWAGMRGAILETPKPDDPIFASVRNVIIASNYQAAQAALAQARQEGWNALLLTTYLQGEARQAGRLLAAIACQVAVTGQPLSRPACIVLGGETTVTIFGSGLGGRNQEMALGSAVDLDQLVNTFLVTLATDGGDGPTDSAGAVVTGETLARARAAGLAPQAFLDNNDSYHFFLPLDDLLRPGPTLTNVNDLAFLFLL